MSPLRSGALAAALFTLLFLAQPNARVPGEERGEVGLALLLRKLATTGTMMHVTAHPDDEHNGLMAMQSHGQGFRVALATATRGNGGQNEIGPELSEALGVLRTEELLAAHRFDGAEQWFARAVDFGYSFSIEETYERWGRDETVGDYVRLIRMIRPDVMVAMRPDGEGGGQHHQAASRLGVEAFRAAGNPARYPEQLQEGLRPWQPLKIYQVAFYGALGGETRAPTGIRLVPVDVDVYDPLLGRTYAEIGSEARAMHKCQGFGQLLALPGAFTLHYMLADTTIAGQKDTEEASLTDGLDLSLRSLARFAAPNPPPDLTGRLDAVANAITDAGRRLRTDGPEGAAASLAAGLRQVRELRAKLPSLGIDPFEIDFRLKQTEAKFEQALVLAHSLRIEVLADDGVVMPGQPVALETIVANRGRASLAVRQVVAEGFAGGTLQRTAAGPGARGRGRRGGDATPQPLGPCTVALLQPAEILRCTGEVTVPADARITEPYWRRPGEAGRYQVDADAPFGRPFRPTPFQVAIAFELDGVPVTVAQPVRYRYEGNIFSGEKRMDLQVVPSFAVRVSPEIAIVPLRHLRPLRQAQGEQAQGRAVDASKLALSTRELIVHVTTSVTGPSEAEVALAVPAGWTVVPASVTITFARQDEAGAMRFRVTPPAGAQPATYPIRAVLTSREGRFDRGYDAIEYPHTERRHIYQPAETTIKIVDVALPAGLRIGYIMGVGDQVPAAIRQLGASVDLLGEDDLGSGDLSKYDAIVTGVRAYERRPDLRAYNQQLLRYAEGGGTVLVQYNKFEFNQAQYGPLPANVSANRVTDEHSPVVLLEPAHPVFTRPNRIQDAAWKGWVQERGLYFLGERDSQYVDLVELSDPFPFNAGPKRGALVEARVGTGRWIYVGLNLWRQLPAGTEGAYQLLANLLAVGRD
jgi:LmbE family N-acetylglucosaminyl deacetylase